jgi:hypothetical protein
MSVAYVFGPKEAETLAAQKSRLAPLVAAVM